MIARRSVCRWAGVLVGVCLTLASWGACSASAGFINPTGIVTIAQFQTTTPFNSQLNNQTIPFPSPFVFSPPPDNILGASAFGSLGYRFSSGTNLFGITVPQGAFVATTAAPSTLSNAVLFLQFSVTYLADANGVFNVPSGFGTTIVANTSPLLLGSFATFSGQLNYTLVGGPNPGTFATQTLSWDTRVNGQTPGTFISAPSVTVNVVPGQFLNLSGFLRFQAVGNAAIGIPASVGGGKEEPEPVPEPASLTLLAAGALGLLVYGWHRRRRAA